MTRAAQPLVFVAGVALAVVTVAVARWHGGATTYAGASAIAAAGCAAMIAALAAAAATRRALWPAAAAAFAVTLPIWAGTASSPAVRGLADALAPAALPLVLGVGGRPRRALVAVTALLVVVRLFLRDPLFDVHCFADCLSSPFVVVRASDLARAVDLAGGLLLAPLALRLHGRPRDIAGPALLAAGIALRAAALVADPQELATRPALQIAYGLVAAGATTIAAVATIDALTPSLAQRVLLRLARDLGADATRADLEAALRRITRDPALAILADGEAAEPVSIVRIHGREVARIAHRPGAERAVERALGPSVRLALANAMLRERLEQRVARLRATRERVVTLGDAARRGFERDLHDGAQQGVLAVLYELRLQAAHAAGTPLADRLDAAADEAAAALEELRELAHGIHPRILIEAGLRPALRSLAASAPLEILATPAGRYPAAIESTVYRVIDEAVHNTDPQRIAVSVVERAGALITTAEHTGGGFAELDDLVGMCGGSLTVSDGGFQAVIPCA